LANTYHSTGLTKEVSQLAELSTISGSSETFQRYIFGWRGRCAMIKLSIETAKREEIIEITGKVSELLPARTSGVVWLHCPHTTCALTIQENFDPDLRIDFLAHLRTLVPQSGFLHSEGNADAHIKAALLGSTQPVLFERGAMVLGRWQSIWFVELDGPRVRKVLVRVVEH
jgi:secondary thiamine-phosphate synthase enzyme